MFVNGLYGMSRKLFLMLKFSFMIGILVGFYMRNVGIFYKVGF